VEHLLGVPNYINGRNSGEAAVRADRGKAPNRGSYNGRGNSKAVSVRKAGRLFNSDY